MRVNTVLKLGSLALNVAQDEKVRELATIIHKGAKRRGLWGPPPTILPQGQQDRPKAAMTNPSPHPVVSAKPTTNPKIPFAPGSGVNMSGLGGLEKYLTIDNAKKALDWAGVVKNLLVK